MLIPLYRRGGFVSAYQYLAARFGRYLQGLASVTFVFTRLLAEGVRLFASAIPIKLLLDEFGVATSYGTIIVVLTAITVVYTYLGGIKAVIWTDAIQMGLYLGGAVLAIIVLSAHGRRRRLRRGGGRGQVPGVRPELLARAHPDQPVRPAHRDHRRGDLRDGQPRLGPADRAARARHPLAARLRRRR